MTEDGVVFRLRDCRPSRVLCLLFVALGNGGILGRVKGVDVIHKGGVITGQLGSAALVSVCRPSDCP